MSFIPKISFNKLNNPKEFFFYLKETNVFFWIMLLLALSAVNLLVEYPLNQIFVSVLCLFVPGYLFSTLVLGKLGWIETIVLGITVSTGLLVTAVLVLHSYFLLSFDKATIVEAGILCTVILFGLHQLKRYVE